MQHDKQRITRTMMQQMVELIFEKDSGNPTGSMDQKSELLEEKMAAILPKELFDPNNIPSQLSVLCDISGISNTETFKSVIKNEKAELGLLMKMKDYFKYLSGKSTNETEHQIFISIYYAFIASALLHHNETMSSYSYKELADSFSRLLKEDWLPEYILKLYRQAQTCCCQKAMKLKAPSGTSDG